MALLYPEIAIEAMIVLLAVTMIVAGSSAIVIGVTHKGSSLQRGISVGAGTLVLGLSMPVILIPDLAMFAIIILISFSFLINGMEIISSGITGHRQKHIF